MGVTFDPPPGVTPEQECALAAYLDDLVGKLPPPPPELIAKLRPILASDPAEPAAGAA